MKREPTPLEEMLLDELRHVLLIIKDRMITPKNYIQFMGELKAAITEAEDTLEGKSINHGNEYKMLRRTK